LQNQTKPNQTKKMEFCISPPMQSECCLDLWDYHLCFECGETMPSNPEFAKEIRWANYLVVLILFIVGFWNINSFYRVYKQNNNYISIMRLGNILYAFGTGIFGILRVHTQFGKPLLVFAAFHNLSEWIFVAYSFYKNRKQREQIIIYSIIFILIVVGVVIIIISAFPYYALVEQITGISLDFMLPIIWFILWTQNKDVNNGNDNRKKTGLNAKHTATKSINAIYSIRDIYFIAFVAHLIHVLFTILPLVIVNFIRDQNEMLSRIIEFMIFLSVPITHILYTRFTNLYEKNIDLPTIKDSVDYDENNVIQIPSCLSSPVIKMLFWYLVCIGIGLFPIVIIPNVLPQCINDNIINESDNFMIGTSTGYVYPEMGQTFECIINSQNLVENARNYPGNIFYYFTKHMTNPDQYVFVEAWESVEAVQNWIQSKYVRDIFDGDDVKNILINGSLQDINAYLPLLFDNKEKITTEDKIGNKMNYTMNNNQCQNGLIEHLQFVSNTL